MQSYIVDFILLLIGCKELVDDFLKEVQYFLPSVCNQM